MSDLLERYVQAVGRYLAADGRDDTLAELRANLLAEMDDKSEALGRPLTEEEEVEVLRRHGHPSLVAARYRPQRSLIGPEIFPYYWLTLRRGLPFVLGIFVILRAVELIYGPPQTHVVVNSVVRLFWVVFYFSGWMTLLFASVEELRARYPQKVTFHADWDPRKLAKAELEEERDLPKNPLADLVLMAVFSLVWLLLPYYHGYLPIGPDSLALRGMSLGLGPVWVKFYWLVAALNVVQLIFKIVAFKRSARPWRKQIKLVDRIVGLPPAILLLQERQYVFFVGSVPDAAHKWLVRVVNVGVHRTAELVVVLLACKITWDVGKMILEFRKHDGPVPSSSSG
jgi:hypothetical protein